LHDKADRYTTRTAYSITANPLLRNIIAEFKTVSYLNGLSFVAVNVTVGLHTANQLLQ
jgi:hypothetical protein